MKSKKLSRILAGLLAFGGIVLMAGCQSADKSQAYTPANETTVTIYTEASTGSKRGTATIGIANNTIYNVDEVKVTYTVYDDGGQVIGDEGRTTLLPTYVQHGVAGYITYIFDATSVGPDAAAATVKVTKVEVTHFQSLWDSYIVGWIMAIVIVGISLIFSAFEIFRSGWTKESLAQFMREKTASALITLGLVALICLIPLMFSSWVTTLILVGSFAASVVCAGLMTIIKVATIKK